MINGWMKGWAQSKAIPKATSKQMTAHSWVWKSYLLKANSNKLIIHLLIDIGSWLALKGLQGFSNLLKGPVVWIFGVATAPLLPRVIRQRFPGHHVHFQAIWWPGDIPQALPYLLQHVLAVSTVVARGEGLGSHLSVSLGFLPSLHVKTCMLTANEENRVVCSAFLLQGRCVSNVHTSVPTIHFLLLLSWWKTTHNMQLGQQLQLTPF